MKRSLLSYRNTLKVLSALFVAIILTSCSDVFLKPEHKPDHILIKPTKLRMFVGSKAKLNIELVNKRGNREIKPTPAWLDTTYTTSNNNNVVKIKNGLIKAVNPGNVELTVKIGTYAGYVSIRVKPRIEMIQSTQSLDSQFQWSKAAMLPFFCFLQIAKRE